MRLSRLPHSFAWLRLAALVAISLAPHAFPQTFSADSGEIAPGLTLPAGTALPFLEDELLNPEATARLERNHNSFEVRAKTLLTQGLVGRAINELVAEYTKVAAAGGDGAELAIPLAVAYQHAGRFADALAAVRSMPEGELTKHKEFMVVLERAEKEVQGPIALVVERLKANPKDAENWARPSRLWLEPTVHVRRNALAAASVAIAASPESESARTAMAEALAAYAFTTWSSRPHATSWERDYRQGLNRPPRDVYRNIVARIDACAPRASMVAKLKDLYTIAAQDPGSQREGARLERALITRTPPLPDARYPGYEAAVALLAAEDSMGTWEHYKALNADPATRHYFNPLRIAARPVQLALYELCKTKLDDQMEALKAVPSLPLPESGDYVFWEGWRWLARGIAASRTLVGFEPPQRFRDAVLHIERAQQNHEMDGALLGAIGEAWFAGYRLYSKDKYEMEGKEFLARSVSALDAAAEAGIDIDSGVVRAAALRASREYDRAAQSVLKLTDPGLPSEPTTKDKERVAVQWLKLAFLYLDHRPVEDSQRIAGNCLERARKLMEGPDAGVFIVNCRALAGLYDRSGISTHGNSDFLTYLPPFGAEVYVRLCEADLKLSYLELIRLSDLQRDAMYHGSFVTDPRFHEQIPLPLLTLQVENLVASPEGFPIVIGFKDELERRVRRAFSSQNDFARYASDPKDVSIAAGLKGIEARALESLLIEAREGMFGTVNALHQAMSSGAVKKQFEPDHGNATVCGVLHPAFRLVDSAGTKKKETPILQAETSWEDFVFSLAVGYINWASQNGNVTYAVLGLDELKAQVREVSPLRPNRSDELTVATNRFDTRMTALLKEEYSRIARENAEREARRQQEAAEEARRQEEWRRNPVVGGLDFSVPEPTRPPVYTYREEEQRAPERITCSVCGGSGVITTQTNYSNAARQTCWRCKGKGWRSPHDM